MRHVGGDGEIGELCEEGTDRYRTANVGVVQYWGEDPIKEHEADEDVHFGPPGYKWIGNPGDLGPVKGDDAHAQSAGNAKELVGGYIVGEYPAHE